MKATAKKNTAHMKKRCCGHHCPVCGGPARPLGGFCKKPECNCEADVPWRIKLGRKAHKCYGEQHRFDVDTETGTPLPDFMYRLPDGVIQTVPAGTKIDWGLVYPDRMKQTKPPDNKNSGLSPSR
jgi:hypothetical protein